MTIQTSLLRVTGMATVALAAAASIACTPSTNVNPAADSPVPVQVVVNNNLLRPTDIAIYTVAWDGQRQLLGSVPPRSTRTFSFTPESASTQYRLLATRTNGRDITSQIFTISPEMTGPVTWTMIPNLIGFRGTDPDTTGTPP